MPEIGYYNYYNNPYRYSPESVQNRYKKMEDVYNSDTLHANNENPYSEKNLARKQLDEELAPMAEALRSKFSSADDVRRYLSKKYFGTEDFAYTKKWDEPETYAMFQNDLNAVLYGTVGGANFADPRMKYTQQDWDSYESEEKASRQASISSQMKKLLSNNGINLSGNDSLLISINPYSYASSVDGTASQETLSKVSSLLNSDSSSKELLFYILQNSSDINPSSLNKYRAYQNILDLAGYDISKLYVENDEYYTSDGKKLLEILKDKIGEDNTIGKEFKGAAYEYSRALLDKLINDGGWDNVNDLSLSIGYSDEAGFYMMNKEYTV